MLFSNWRNKPIPFKRICLLMYFSYPVICQANESLSTVGKRMKLIFTEEWAVRVCGVCPWVQCGLNTEPHPQNCTRQNHNLMHLYLPSLHHLHLESGFASPGLVWDWHMLTVRVPTVQTCDYLDLIWFLKRFTRSLQEGASLRSWRVSWWRLWGFFSCVEAIFARTVCSWVLSFSVGLIWREKASTGKGCRLGAGPFTPGSGRER